MKPRTLIEQMSNPSAVCTRHCHAEKIRCGGALFRTLDGADKLSERLGRIVVVCDKCGSRFSLSTADTPP